MLGIAQISGGFTVTSKMKDGKAFRAHVRLYDLLKDKLDKNDAEVFTTKTSGVVEVDVGTFDFDLDFDPAKARQGTSIVADDVHPTFVKAFQESLKSPKFIEPPADWLGAIQAVSKVRTLQEIGDYWRLLWELATSCPVPYVSNTCLPRKIIATEQELLESYDFKVIVDGLELRKPVLLKGNPAGYTTKVIDEQHFTPYNRDLRFHGYLAVQEGSQLKPDELRGILVRIKNVAIGYYDPSMLDYRYNEGPRSRWLTGEIYVTEGLEDALNVDRDSFNRFHPQFRALQEYVHQVLHADIFPAVYKQIEVRSAVKASAKREARSLYLEEVISKTSDLAVSFSSSASRNMKQQADPKIIKRAHSMEVSMPDESTVSTKKSNRQLANAILALFEVAMTERDLESRREIFRKSLLSLLAKW